MHAFSLQNVLKLKGSGSRLLENSTATAYICAFSLCPVFFPYACCYWFTWLVSDVFVSADTLPLVAFAFVMFVLSVSFTLMIYVLIGFVYCF